MVKNKNQTLLSREIGELKPRYPHIRDLARRDRRREKFRNRSLIAGKTR